MTKPSSPLRRLLPLLELGKANESLPAPIGQMWMALLGVVPLGKAVPAELQSTMLRTFAGVCEEFSRAYDSMRFTALEAELYNQAFTSVRPLFSANHIAQNWDAIAPGALTPETLSILRICTRLAPVMESSLSETELQDIDIALATLENAVSQLPHDSGLFAVLLEQLQLMRQARIDYTVAGASALRRATYGLDGALVHIMAETAPMTAAARVAIDASTAVSRAVKAAIKTAGLVAALGGGVAGVEKIAASVAESMLFFQGQQAPLTDNSSGQARLGPGGE